MHVCMCIDIIDKDISEGIIEIDKDRWIDRLGSQTNR